jgi:hypothetical protein
VGGDRGQSPGKSKAVGEKEVATPSAELLLEEAVAVEDVTDERLGRDHVDIGGVEHAAGHGPPTLLDVALQPLELFRVVLLDQHVTEGTLEAQHKKWIALEVGEVSLQCCRQEVADGVLNRPPPLGVEVDGGDDVEMQGTARGLAIGPGHGSGVYDGRR